MSDDVNVTAIKQALSGLVSACDKLETRVENMESSVKKLEKEVSSSGFGSSISLKTGMNKIFNDLENVKSKIRSIDSNI